MSSTKRVVLVTGLPRSGTTIVGKLLGVARGARYLYEPMHAECGVRAVRNWFEIPGTRQFPCEVADECIHKISRLDLDLKPVRKADGNFLTRFLKKHVTGTQTKVSYRLCRLDPFLKTIIWKDPLACFLVEHASTNYRIPIIATLRNPLATMASYKRVNWGTRYNDIYDLAERLREIGFSFPDQISANPQHNGEAAYGAAMFWHLIYSVLLAWHERGVAFHIVDIDRLVAQPMAVCRELYAFAGLDLGQAEKRGIDALCGSGTASREEPRRGKIHDLQNDPRANRDYWRRVLRSDEIEFCNALNADLWNRIAAVANPQRSDRAISIFQVA